MFDDDDNDDVTGTANYKTRYRRCRDWSMASNKRLTRWSGVRKVEYGL
jgi:hypothetical protein